jgi:hypothetical protein
VILVDTSVLIDFFKGVPTAPARKFRKVLAQQIPFGITSFIYQEVLQGAKSEEEYSLLRKYLETQNFYQPLHPVETYERAAKMYFNCRKKGLTIRSTIDCLIAQISLEHRLLLLHDDSDFVRIAKVVGLKFY